jgi:hypothetical protein
MRWYVVCGVLVAVLAGCGGSGGSAPASPAAASTAPPVTRQAEPAHPFKAWAAANYPGADWLPHVAGVRDQLRQTWVATDLSADPAGLASAICAAVSAWQISVRGGFGGVRVATASGERLVLREGLADPC